MRAWEWARQKHGREAAVVGAVIALGDCFDLTDTWFTTLLSEAHQELTESFRKRGKSLPRNGGKTPLEERRELDCLVVNYCIEDLARGRHLKYDTVRSPFWEGPRVFPGSMFHRESHIQIAVRNADCIKGVFRPNF
ncbi:MAG: hypothetical protein AB1405_09560 [Bdellovibrionota bacterium]